MNITITTTAKTDAEAKALLAAFQFPVQELRAAMAKLALINRNEKRKKLVAEVREEARGARRDHRRTRRPPTRTASRRA